MTALERNLAEFDEALKKHDRQLLRFPDDELVWMWRGKIFWGVQRYDDAARAFSQGMARCPHYGPLYRDRGHVLINGGHFAEAAADCVEAHRLMGDDWDVLYHYALSCFLIGDYERSTALYHKAFERARNDGERVAVVNWTWASLLHLGKLDEARATLQRIPDDAPVPKGEEGYYRIIFTAKGKLTPEQGFGDAGIVPEILSMTSAYGVSNYCRYVLGDTQKADAICKEILKVGEKELYHTFGYRAAQAEMGEGERPAPRDEWDEQIQAERWNEYSWFRKAHAYAEENELSGAICTASRALVYVRDPARFFQHRGRWFISVGEYEKSVSDSTRAALLRPHDKGILYHCGIAHYLLAEYDAAEQAFRHVANTAAGYAQTIPALNWLWACLSHQGKSAEAEALLAAVPDNLTGLDEGTFGYYNLLMLYKGLRDPETMLRSGDHATEYATRAYGLSNYYCYVARDAKKAAETLDCILENVKPPFTGAFGYRAARNERDRQQSGAKLRKGNPRFLS